MNLIPEKSPLRIYQDADEAAVLEVAEAAHNLATKMRAVHTAFWARPTNRLLDALNADVPMTLARFSGNTALGTAVNAALDAVGLPQFASRVPLVLGRDDITFDATAGMFIEIPSEPVAAPAPAPAPE